MSVAQLKELVRSGMNVGGHSRSHPDLRQTASRRGEGGDTRLPGGLGTGAGRKYPIVRLSRRRFQPAGDPSHRGGGLLRSLFGAGAAPE